MNLDYVALGILAVVVAFVVYGSVAIWSIPYEIAKARNHPHQDAIGAATWVSLLTLGVLWPFLWIWAMAYREDRGWGLSGRTSGDPTVISELEQLKTRVATLEQVARGN